jgi:catechol 2,3-dioxygenase-like lactoylglutathione lyase family enzyme
MKVKRIVANVVTPEPNAAQRFYGDILGLELMMDEGFIVTYGSREKMAAHISFVSAGGSGAPTPDLSIEVDDVDEAFRKMAAAGIAIEYGPTVEPWGVKRFFVRDPFGKLVNILEQAAPAASSYKRGGSRHDR